MTDARLPPDELADLAAQMSPLVLSAPTMTAAVELLTGLALQTVDGASGAGVSLIDDNEHRLSTASTSELVVDADEAQYRLDEGPCLTAWSERRTVRVDDTRRETRWPRWAAAAQSLGLRATVSAPLLTGRQSFGAVKVYSPTAGAFADRTERLMRGIADTAAVLLANVVAQESRRRESTDFQQALQHPGTVRVARDILMWRYQMSAEAAVRLLENEARTTRRTLQEVAASIVDAANEPST